MAAGRQNLLHALQDQCEDPDCELHNPEVIEDESERQTALAWYYLGVAHGARLLGDEVESVLQNVREDMMNDEKIEHLHDS